MLSSHDFDLWADDYEQSVAQSHAAGEYPFAGYPQVLGAVYRHIRRGGGSRYLDVGLGTGVLARRLYGDGYSVYGLDFSPRMIEAAQEKMPKARLLCRDFSQGLPEEWREERFDAIACTYAIHHLDDVQKVNLIQSLLGRLFPGGQLLIGDVAFESVEALKACRARCAGRWDDQERYPVAQTLMRSFPGLSFEQHSFCAGVLRFTRRDGAGPDSPRQN